MKILLSDHDKGNRIRVKDRCVDSGREGLALGPSVKDYQGREWTPVLWDDEENPDFSKTQALESVPHEDEKGSIVRAREEVKQAGDELKHDHDKIDYRYVANRLFEAIGWHEQAYAELKARAEKDVAGKGSIEKAREWRRKYRMNRPDFTIKEFLDPMMEEYEKAYKEVCAERDEALELVENYLKVAEKHRIRCDEARVKRDEWKARAEKAEKESKRLMDSQGMARELQRLTRMWDSLVLDKDKARADRDECIELIKELKDTAVSYYQTMGWTKCGERLVDKATDLIKRFGGGE